MNEGFGGKLLPMRSSIIKKEEGYLGQFQQTLQPGQVQHFVFQPNDVGPFWLSAFKGPLPP
jgi:hypothetical protein